MENGIARQRPDSHGDEELEKVTVEYAMHDGDHQHAQHSTQTDHQHAHQ